MNAEKNNTNSMVGELLRVMVCPPRHAGWDQKERAACWHELGFHHPPSSLAQAQHDTLCGLLTDDGAELLCLPPADSLTLDAVYAHDSSLPTEWGLILMNPGKSSRGPEVKIHREFALQRGIAILGEIRAPAHSEAGDMVWLDHNTLLVGCGYRTNQAGIEQVRSLLAPNEVEVLSAPLPYDSGPEACLHLMSLMSMLDEHTVLVDLPWLAVETVELLKGLGLRLMEIDYAERKTLACNVLSLGKQRLIALEENARTNQRLRQAGFEVRTFPGSELCINGSGGPTCLTRALLRS